MRILYNTPPGICSPELALLGPTHTAGRRGDVYIRPALQQNLIYFLTTNLSLPLNPPPPGICSPELAPLGPTHTAGRSGDVYIRPALHKKTYFFL